MKYIPIRICSPGKSDVKNGYLKEIYTLNVLQTFFRIFPEHAILSRKYGICLWNHKYDNYPDSEMKEDEDLLELLKEQAKESYFQEITLVYYKPNKPRHERWIRLLRDAGFKIIEKHTLREIEQFISGEKICKSPSSIDAWLRKKE